MATLSPAGEADYEFAFEVKRQALGPYVEARWGWDEALQRTFHLQRWTERPWSIITSGDQRVGTVSVARTPTHLQFGEFYLLPSFQNQGIGSEVLRAVLRQADVEKLAVRLEYLRNNPVGTLYKRHGFVVVAEDDSHYFLVRAPHEPSV